MAFQDIISLIEKEADDRIAAMLAVHAEKIQAHAIDQQKRYDEKKSQLLTDLQTKVSDKKMELTWRLAHKKKTSLLEERQQAVLNVYVAVLQKLEKLDDDKATTVMAGLLQQLPAEAGEIIPTKSSRHAITAAIKETKRKDVLSKENTEGAGGFVFKGKNVTIDFRYEQMMSELRERTIAKVNHTLFA